MACSPNAAPAPTRRTARSRNNGSPRPTARWISIASFATAFAPNKPIWLTETAQAACGGDRWAATFLDTFRYLDQLGRLAKAGIHVVMHNTLAASDYGLLNENNFAPRPNYWAALLWHRLMGTTVLESGVPGRAGLHLYAHCLKGTPGGVSVLVLNTDRNAAATLILANASERYTLDAAKLDDQTLRLNGHALALGANDELPVSPVSPRAPAHCRSHRRQSPFWRFATQAIAPAR